MEYILFNTYFGFQSIEIDRDIISNGFSERENEILTMYLLMVIVLVNIINQPSSLTGGAHELKKFRELANDDEMI